MYLVSKSSNETEVANKKVQVYKDVDVYKDIAKNEETIKNNDEKIEKENKLEETKEDEATINEKEGIKITALGEIMMGGSNYAVGSYSLAFKEIASYMQNSDYVVSTLSTCITSVKDLSDTKTKYVVNESIVNAFSALKIKGINIATDHMLDFSKNIFSNTVNVLRKNSIDVIGLDSDIAYAENNGIRVAFIGVNNVIIGNMKNYTDVGISVYDMGKIKNSIKEARKNADVVIVMPHYGKENEHQVTDVMRWFSRELVNAGADMVLGSHALGVYPIEEYKGKVIIYSLGYLIHDTNNEQGKISGIFDFNINAKGVIEKIEVTPTYILNKNMVKLYKDINVNKNKAFLNEINKDNYTMYTTKIENDKLVMNLK